MAISFVAAGTSFNSISSGTGFTLNKPAGVTDGDLMLATLTFDTAASLRTITLSGWTLVKSAWGSDDGRQNQVSVFYRFFVTGDPSSWSATLSASSSRRTAVVTAYRGVQAVGASGTSAAGAVTSYSTATVNNTVANSWRVVAASYSSLTINYTISSNETTRRALVSADDSGGSGNTVQAAVWDSDTTTVATGNTSRTVSRSASWSTSSSVILLLQPSTGTPASGTLASTLPKLSAAADGEIHDDGTVAASLPSMTSAADGYGQPPVVTGTLTGALGPISASVAAATDNIGTLDVTVLPSLNIQGETRVFGERVITVEADDRTIVVPSRGVSD